MSNVETRLIKNNTKKLYSNVFLSGHCGVIVTRENNLKKRIEEPRQQNLVSHLGLEGLLLAKGEIATPKIEEDERRKKNITTGIYGSASDYSVITGRETNIEKTGGGGADLKGINTSGTATRAVSRVVNDGEAVSRVVNGGGVVGRRAEAGGVVCRELDAQGTNNFNNSVLRTLLVTFH